MWLFGGVQRRIPVEQLPVFPIAIDVVPCLGPRIINGAPAAPTLAGVFNRPKDLGPVGSSKEGLDRLQSLAGGI